MSDKQNSIIPTEFQDVKLSSFHFDDEISSNVFEFEVNQSAEVMRSVSNLMGSPYRERHPLIDTNGSSGSGGGVNPNCNLVFDINPEDVDFNSDDSFGLGLGSMNRSESIEEFLLNSENFGNGNVEFNGAAGFELVNSCNNSNILQIPAENPQFVVGIEGGVFNEGENRNDIAAAHDVDSDANDGKGNATESICFENFAGDYKFRVYPVSPGSRAKLFYDEDNCKIYCAKGPFDFGITMDFKSIPSLEGWEVRGVVAFTDAQFKDFAVQRCFNCAEKDRKEGKEVSMQHVLQKTESDRSSKYGTSEVTGRNYLIIPVTRPQPGCEHNIQSIYFGCLSSCRSTATEGINRRSTALIFTLIDQKNNIRGRSVLHLRICSAPKRDFGITAKQTSAKRIKLDEDGRGKEVAIKIENVVVDDEVAGTSANLRHALNPIPEPVSGPSSTSKVVPKEMKVLTIENFPLLPSISNSQDTSSSQETAYSDDDFPGNHVKLRSIARQTRLIFQWKSSEDVGKRNTAYSLMACWRLAQALCKKAIDTYPEKDGK